MTIPRIARPEEGPLDFLMSLHRYKAKIFSLDSTDPVIQNFHQTWNDLRSLVQDRDVAGLKHYQTRLAPWPPVVLLALEPQTSPFIHAGWQMLLEMHTVARWYVERPHLKNDTQWQTWIFDFLAMHPQAAQSSPAHTSVPGVLREGVTLAVVSTQPFSFVPGNQSLMSLTSMDKSITDFRLHTPAAPMFDQAHREAASTVFGAHSVRETSKLAFWSMVNAAGTDVRAALKWRPRYYGGPAGTPSWGLHDVASVTGQVASKARLAMVDWMLNLSDSMVEQLHLGSATRFTPVHQDFVQAYTRSLNVVSAIGMGHKRTVGGINELLGYTTKIQDLLQRSGYPLLPELQKVNSKIRQQLKVEEGSTLVL